MNKPFTLRITVISNSIPLKPCDQTEITYIYKESKMIYIYTEEYTQFYQDFFLLQCDILDFF